MYKSEQVSLFLYYYTKVSLFAIYKLNKKKEGKRAVDKAKLLPENLKLKIERL